jgi:signal transduction histidine kinase/ActR/RegA family two-component response regulator
MDISKIIQAGTKDVAIEDTNRIIVVNTLSFITAMLAASMGSAIFLYSLDISILIAGLLEGLLFSGIIILNYYGKHFLACVGFLLMHNAAVVYFGIGRGMVIEEEMLTVFLIIVSLLILKPIWQQIISITISCLALFAAIINKHTGFITITGLQEESLDLFHELGLAAIFSLIIIAIGFFKKHIVYLIKVLKKTNENLDELVIRRTKELERANQNLNIFVREISHDIRDELNALIGMNQLMKVQIEDPIYRSMQPMVMHQYASSMRISAIVSNILDLRHIEAGKFDSLNNSSFNLRIWSDELVSSCQYNADSKSVRIIAICSGDLPTYIVTDKTMLDRIIKNLVANAIKFSAPQSQVSINVFSQEDNLCIDVKDEGVGIAQKDLHSIFDLYVTDPNNQQGKLQGTGLGLHIVKRLTASLKGKVNVTSEPGKGTVFHLSFPLVKGVAEITHKNDMESRPITISGNTAKILVVDDNPANLVFMKGLLARLKCRVFLAEDGEKGLQTARIEKPDLILLDAQMPVLNGLETLRLIKQDEALKKIPVIIITANAYEDVPIEFSNAGAADFLQKPIVFSKFKATVDKLLMQDFSSQ